MEFPTSRRAFLKRATAGSAMLLRKVRAVMGGSDAIQTGGQPSGSTPVSDQSDGPPAANEAVYTRGIGLYPGDPNEDFSPALVKDDSNAYRNLALLRSAYHSSSYDYNLTAQLVTDGIRESSLPMWVETSASLLGEFPKEQREILLDHDPTSTVELRGTSSWVQFRLGGGKIVPRIDRIDLLVVVTARNVKPENIGFAVAISDDGRSWTKAGNVTGPQPASIEGYPFGFALPGQLFKPSIPLNPASQSRYYRIECTIANPPAFSFGSEWKIGSVAFYNSYHRVEVGGPYNFTSAWMSGGLGEEWVYVDLGAPCEFDRIALYWIAKAVEGSIRLSDDAQN